MGELQSWSGRKSSEKKNPCVCGEQTRPAVYSLYWATPAYNNDIVEVQVSTHTFTHAQQTILTMNWDSQIESQIPYIECTFAHKNPNHERKWDDITARLPIQRKSNI
jgi:hypothetical protein